MSICAIIAGGGRGVRMGKSINKQFLEISSKPIIAHTIDKFVRCKLIDDIILTIPVDWIEFVKQEIIGKYNFKKVKHIAGGGINRQASVFNALQYIENRTSLVAVHDAVRPFVQIEHIEKLIAKAEEFGAAILAVPVQDTIKIVSRGIVEKTLKRDELWKVQTPQVFRKELIFEAYETIGELNFVATDDASLVERLGYRVYVVKGDEANIKITRPVDLHFAEYLINQGLVN